jgi:hypothetical protein
MKIKIMYPNNKGKIELTKEELEKLLNESYSEGYSDGCYKSYYSISTPSYPRITYDSNDLNISLTASTANPSNTAILNNCVKTDDSLTIYKIEETEICNVAGIGVMKINEV